MGNAAGVQASGDNAAGASAAPGGLRNAPIDIDKLSEEDVLSCLDQLGLGAYKPTFTQFGIEGATLLDLDRDMLKNDMLITNESDSKLILQLVEMVRNGASAEQIMDFEASHSHKSRPRRRESVVIPENVSNDSVGALPSDTSESKDGSREDGASAAASTEDSGSAAPGHTILKKKKTHKLRVLTGGKSQPRLAMQSPKVKATLGGIGRLNSLCEFTNADPEYWGPDRTKLRAAKKKARIIRVFLSSTFRDFARERDHLFKNVFPRMEQACAGRGLQFIPIDLRWGVTAEESGRGDVIKLCLQEIDECTPFFVCMLGERYGWHQEKRDGDALLQKTFDVGAEIYPWCKEYETVSATEMEIRHAYLNDPDSMPYPFFYFRNPKFPEIHGLSEEESQCYFASSDYARTMQGRLKDEIRVRAKFPLPPEYDSVEELGKQMEADLWRAIDEEFPKTDLDDPLSEQRFYHDSYAEARIRVYIQMDTVERTMFAKAANLHNTGGGIIVTGPAGCGKTAALAHWKRTHAELQARGPKAVAAAEAKVTGHDDSSNTEYVYIEHYLSATPEAAHINGMLPRLYLEIQSLCGLEETMPMPNKAALVRELFPDLCDAAANIMVETGRILVVVIGGLHRMIGSDDTAWLPPRVKPGLLFVISVTEGDHMHHVLSQRVAVQEAQWPTVHMPELDREKKTTLIKKYLIQFGKKLSSEQESMIAEKRITDNPMFLVNFLEEIRVYGSYEGLTDYARSYLDADSIEELFNRVLGRVENAYPNFPVAKAFSYMTVSREGLNEDELLTLLGVRRAGDYTSFKHAVASFIQPIKGCLRFLHAYAATAARQRYLHSGMTERELHSELANYFAAQWEIVQHAKRHVNKFKIAHELLYQLEQAKRFPELAERLSDIEIFATLEPVTVTRFEMMRWWGELEGEGHKAEEYFMKKMRTMFSTIKQHMSFANMDHVVDEADATQQRMHVLKALAHFFNDMGLYNIAATILQTVLKHQRMAGGAKIARSEEYGHDMHTLGQMYFTAGNEREAQTFLSQAKQVLSATDPVANEEHIIRINIMLANLFKKRHQYKEAKSLIESAIVLCRKRVAASESKDKRSMNAMEIMRLHRNQELLADNLNDLGMLLNTMGQGAESLQIYKESLNLTQLLNGPEHINVARTLQNVAIALIATSHLPEAEEHYKRAVAILLKILGDRHPETATVQMNLAVLYGRMKRSEEALGLAKLALQVHQAVFGEMHAKMEGNYMNMGKIMIAHGMATRSQQLVLDGIGMYIKSGEVACKVHGSDHPSLARIYQTIGKTCFKLKKRDEALEYYLRAQAVVGKNPDVAALAAIGKECSQVTSLLQRRSNTMRQTQEPNAT